MASRTELEPLSPDDHAVPGQWQSQSFRDDTARRVETKTTWYTRVRETFRRRDGKYGPGYTHEGNTATKKVQDHRKGGSPCL